MNKEKWPIPLNESKKTFKERETPKKISRPVTESSVKISEESEDTEKDKAHFDKKIEFFFKYSIKLEEERIKLLSKIRALEDENVEWEERFKGSVEQREQLRDSADRVMQMLNNLNDLIDKFLSPVRRKSQSEMISSSQKVLLLQKLVEGKTEFDRKVLGKQKEESQKELQVESELRQSMVDLQGMQQELADSMNFYQQNESEVSISDYQTEDLQDSQGSAEGKEKYTIVVEQQDMKTLTNQDMKTLRNKKENIKFSEEKGLNYIELDSGTITGERKTLTNRSESKGRREMMNINLKFCNDLFKQTYPSTYSKGKSKRKNTQISVQKMKKLNMDALSKNLSETNPSGSNTTEADYDGLYNRHNSLFQRNIHKNPLNASDRKVNNEVSAWDNYNLGMSEKSKGSGRTLSHLKKYEKHELQNRKGLPKTLSVLSPKSDHGSKTQEQIYSPNQIIELTELQKKSCIVRKDDKRNKSKSKGSSINTDDANCLQNYLNPSKSLRQRYIIYHYGDLPTLIPIRWVLSQHSLNLHI